MPTCHNSYCLGASAVTFYWSHPYSVTHIIKSFASHKDLDTSIKTSSYNGISYFRRYIIGWETSREDARRTIHQFLYRWLVRITRERQVCLQSPTYKVTNGGISSFANQHRMVEVRKRTVQGNMVSNFQFHGDGYGQPYLYVTQREDKYSSKDQIPPHISASWTFLNETTKVGHRLPCCHYCRPLSTMCVVQRCHSAELCTTYGGLIRCFPYCHQVSLDPGFCVKVKNCSD